MITMVSEARPGTIGEALRVRIGVLASLSLACTAQSDAYERWPCSAVNGREVFDPYRHYVCMDECSDAFDCPRGSICAKVDEDDDGGFCSIPSTAFQSPRSALLDGFGVEEMAARLVDDEAYELRWTRPSGAKQVNCALFVCPPVFRIPTADGWRRPDDPAEAVIANYHQCAIASELSVLPEGGFNLRERDNQHRLPPGFAAANQPNDTERVCPTRAPGLPHIPGPHGCAPVTELLAGCWAYDDWHAVAATRLVPVDGRQFYSYYNVLAPGGECSEGAKDAFRACVLADEASSGDADALPSHGVCACEQPPCPTDDAAAQLSWECTRPCLSDCDCEGVPEVNGCRAPEIEHGVCVGTTCVALVQG